MEQVKDKLARSNGLSGGQATPGIARAIAVSRSTAAGRTDFGTGPISTAHIERTGARAERDYTIAIVTHNMQPQRRGIRLHRLWPPR